MSQDILKVRRIASLTKILVAAVSAATGCSYSVTFEDCQVTCTGSDSCPSDLTCVSGLCRIGGSTGACGSNVAGDVTLSQTADEMIDHGLPFACANVDGSTAEESWYRVFSLKASGIATTFKVDKVTIGINTSTGGTSGSGSAATGITATVKVGTYGGGSADSSLDLTQVTDLGSASVIVPDTEITESVVVPITASIPGNSNLIVEINNADFKGTGQSLELGATDAAETENAYLRSSFCGFTKPTAQTGNQHIIITVTGAH